MLRLLLPVLLALVGTGGGVAAAMFLLPAAAPEEPHAAADETALLPEGVPPCGPALPAAAGAGAADAHAPEVGAGLEYFRINNQFVIPIVATGRVESLVVVSVSLEIATGTQGDVHAVEPRLRDAFLQVFFDHANLGGFDGVFTSAANMRSLRTALRREAQRVVGPVVTDVLITDIVRQDTAS